MKRKVPIPEWFDPNTIGTVYLIHLYGKIAGHAEHYIGFTTRSLDERMEEHRSGNGACLLAAANRLGIAYEVVRRWDNCPQLFEGELKARKNAWRECPICSPERN